MNQAINTKNSSGFRKLRFETIDACIAEVQRIADAAETGRLKTTGNWTPGQILSHLAAWIHYAYDGFPMRKAPWFIRWILRWRLPSMLRTGVPRGIRIPGAKQGTFGMEDRPTREAVERYLAALQWLASNEIAPHDSPAFGALSHEERIQLNLRHAELHLGYFDYS
jgi:hypothetical protein